jgi:hypothetical protein
MTTNTDIARTAQLGKQSVFIYINQQRQGVRLFASRELSPTGVNKRLITSSDAAAAPVLTMIDVLLRMAREAGMGGRGGSVPTAAAMAAFVPEAARRAGVKEATFLPRTPCYTARILVTL